MVNPVNYIMPAEWEKHSAVWLAWPYDETTYPGRVQIAQAKFCEIIKALESSEKVELLVLNSEMKKKVEGQLKQAGTNLANINFNVTSFADVWTRDYGPTFLVNKDRTKLAWVKWLYNGYGKGDDPYFTPVLVDEKVFDNLRLPGQKFEPGIVMEGGSFDVNGQGTLLTTEQCLLNPNRNPQLNKTQIENYLKQYLGVTKIIWLKKGLTNDHTDGHIDDIAKFVSPSTIMAAYEDNENDENFKILDENYKTLQNSTDQDGKPLEIIKLPMPHMNFDDHIKAPVSYLNYYIGNKAVIVPIFKDQNDAKALEIIQKFFPGRKVTGIDCSDMIYGGGTIHCMTQQQPLI